MEDNGGEMETEQEPLTFHYRDSIRITGNIDGMLDDLLESYEFLRGIFNPVAEKDPDISPALISGLNGPFEEYTKMRAGELTELSPLIDAGYVWIAKRTKDDEFIVHNYIHNSIDGRDLREMENEGNEYVPAAEKAGCMVIVYKDDSADRTFTTPYSALKAGRSEWMK